MQITRIPLLIPTLCVLMSISAMEIRETQGAINQTLREPNEQAKIDETVADLLNTPELFNGNSETIAKVLNLVAQGTDLDGKVYLTSFANWFSIELRESGQCIPLLLLLENGLDINSDLILDCFCTQLPQYKTRKDYPSNDWRTTPVQEIKNELKNLTGYPRGPFKYISLEELSIQEIFENLQHELFLWLLDQGAHINSRNQESSESVAEAVAVKYDHCLERARLEKPDPYALITPVRLFLTTFEELLTHGARTTTQKVRPPSIKKITSYYLEKQLRIAVGQCDIPMVKIILNLDKDHQLISKKKLGEMLISAAGIGSLPIVKILQPALDDEELRPITQAALLRASAQGQSEIVIYLTTMPITSMFSNYNGSFEHEASEMENQKYSDVFNFYNLHILYYSCTRASRQGHQLVVRYLIDFIIRHSALSDDCSQKRDTHEHKQWLNRLFGQSILLAAIQRHQALVTYLLETSKQANLQLSLDATIHRLVNILKNPLIPEFKREQYKSMITLLKGSLL